MRNSNGLFAANPWTNTLICHCEEPLGRDDEAISWTVMCNRGDCLEEAPSELRPPATGSQ